MTTFFRLMDEENKENALKAAVKSSTISTESNTFYTNPNQFLSIPGAPFCYWVSNDVRDSFKLFEKTESEQLVARQGLATSDDFRFLRLIWEVSDENWMPFAKGGEYSQFYSDVHLLVNWLSKGEEIRANLNDKGNVRSNIWMLGETISRYFERPGITWPRRTQKGLGMRVLPAGCFFGDKGPTIFEANNDTKTLLATLAIVCSSAYKYLVSLQMCFGSYEVGVICNTPMPTLSEDDIDYLSKRARKIWSLKRILDSVDECSSAFLCPNLIIGIEFDSSVQQINLLQEEINSYCFSLFKFSENDKNLALRECVEDIYEYKAPTKTENIESVISWAVGVAFSRFNINAYKTFSDEQENILPFSSFCKKQPAALYKHSKLESPTVSILTNGFESNSDLPIAIHHILKSLNIESSIDIKSWIDKSFFSYHLKCSGQ